MRPLNNLHSLTRQMAVPSFTSLSSMHHWRLNAAISLLSVRKMSPALPSASSLPGRCAFLYLMKTPLVSTMTEGDFSLLCSSTTELGDSIPASLRELDLHPCKMMWKVDRFTQSIVNFSPLFALSVVSTYQEVNKIWCLQFLPLSFSMKYGFSPVQFLGKITQCCRVRNSNCVSFLPISFYRS